MTVFNPEDQHHWPIIDAYKNKKLSYKQAEAQLRDLGCDNWEIALYLDNEDGEDD